MSHSINHLPTDSYNSPVEFARSLAPAAPLKPPISYHDTLNLLVYGGYKTYIGDHKVVEDNLYIYPDGSTSCV